MLKDEGGQIDKESGNKVPVGGTKKGVRDDIPINISEGEFIFPEDVTRYIGLKELMNMRQEAKMGLKKMEAMGLMGNADEATIPDDLPFTMDDLIVVQVADKEGSEKDRADMKTGGLGSRSRLLSTPQVRPQPIVVEEGEKVVTDIMEAVEYRNAAGNSIIIMHYGGSPMYPIPAGYSRYDPETGELGEVVNPVTETVKEINDVVTRASQSGKDKAPELPENEFTKAGSWENSPLDMYIKEAKKFSDGSSSIATSIMGVMGASGFGLLTYGLVKLEKRKILNTIDDRIKNATGKQKQELIRIRDTLLGKIKGPNFIEKITNFVDGILAPEEVKTEVKNTAIKDVNQSATVNNPEEVLPYGLTKTDLDAFRGQDVFDISQQAPLDAFSGQDVFDISQQAPITNLLGPIEEVAARDVPVETSQTLTGDNIVGYQDGYEIRYAPDPEGNPKQDYYEIINTKGEVVNYETTTKRSMDPNESLNGLKKSISNLVKSGQIPDGGIRYDTQGMSRPSAVPTATAQQPIEETQTYDQELFNNLKNTISLGKIDDPRLPPEYRGGEGSEGYNRIISEAQKFYGKNIVQDVLNSLTPVVPTATTTTPVQQSRVSPRLGYESGQDVLQSVAPYVSSTIGQPSISQIDYSNIQTSGPPSVPDALRTPLGTAAAASAFEQEATLPQPYDSSVDDLIKQTREALGTSDQSIEETIARAKEVISKDQPLRIPDYSNYPRITEGTTFVSPTQDQTEQTFFGEGDIASLYTPTVTTTTPSVDEDPFAYMFETPITIPEDQTEQAFFGLGDPDIDFTTPTVTPKVEIDFDPSQTLGDPAISGMLPSTPTATPIVSSVSPTETGLSSFEQAFANARAAGQDTFPFEGKTYTTKLASDTEPSVKAASDDKYDGAVVTGTKMTELLGGLKEGETKLKSEVEADNLANVIGVSRQEYDTMSEYEKSQALAGSSSAQEDRERKQAIEALETLASKPRPPSGLGRDEAKRWLQENGYGSIDKKEAPDYIRKLQEDWDRVNKK